MSGTGTRPAERGQRVRDRFGILLLLLATVFIMQGFGTGWWELLITGALQFAALAVAFLATGVIRSRRWLTALGALGLLAFGLGVTSEGQGVMMGLAAVIGAVVLLAMLGSVLVRVLRHRRVTIQTLYGAVCAYVIIGFLFADIYAAFDGLGSQPVFGEQVSRSVYSYFSFITMTTVGFGDYTAKSNLVRRFVAMEATLGQVFIATTLARLVALYKAAPDRPRAGGETQAEAGGVEPGEKGPGSDG